MSGTAVSADAAWPSCVTRLADAAVLVEELPPRSLADAGVPPPPRRPPVALPTSCITGVPEYDE